jgi:hypothetical protein
MEMDMKQNKFNGIVPTGIRLVANPNQKVGPSGAQLSEPIRKVFIESVKSGNLDKFKYDLMTNQIEVRDVFDS